MNAEELLVYDELTIDIESMLHYLDGVRGASPRTLDTYGRTLHHFLEWYVEQGATSWASLTTPTIREYMAVLYDRGLSTASQRRVLSATRTLARYLAWVDMIPTSQYEHLRFVRSRRHGVRLPDIINIEDARRLVEIPDTSDALGLRDRALLEALYASGVRTRELSLLDVSDFDTEKRRLYVRHGKGDRERYALLGRQATTWLSTYLGTGGGRDWLTGWRPPRYIGQRIRWRPGRTAALFVSHTGTRLSERGIRSVVARAAIRAEVTASPKTLRHAFATHLLDGGAGLRDVQELMGHQNINTTQIYTHLSSEGLRRTVNNALPRAARDPD